MCITNLSLLYSTYCSVYVMHSSIMCTLQEFRSFELLRSSRDRINYLLIKEAKIIALTCTHAALKRKDLVELSFKVRVEGTCSLQLHGVKRVKEREVPYNCIIIIIIIIIIISMIMY